MELSERELIAKYFSPQRRAAGIIVGPGDDAAVVSPPSALALSTDTLVCGVHFDAQADPYLLGRKALAVNLSDLAAMGADPQYALLSLVLPQADEKWIEPFAAGWHAALQEYGVDLIGGDLAGGSCLTIAVAVGGGSSSPQWQPLRADTAGEGDAVWVSGRLGQAAAEFAATGGLGCDANSRLLNPVPRIALGRALAGKASAATDLSDGLLTGIERFAQGRDIAPQIDWSTVPLAAAAAAEEDLQRKIELGAGWGEDYELLFAMPQGADDEAHRIAADAGVEVAKIGFMAAGTEAQIMLDGKPLPSPPPERRYGHVGRNPAARAAAEVFRIATAQGLRIAVAESCTSGLLAAQLAELPGSSAFFAGGVVVYAPEAKQALLGVPAEAIAAGGIVSEQVARAMVQGACERFSADAAAATTGWAGPEGGDGQPAGSVWIAAGCGPSMRTRHLLLKGGRERVKQQAVAAAAELLAAELANRPSG